MLERERECVRERVCVRERGRERERELEREVYLYHGTAARYISYSSCIQGNSKHAFIYKMLFIFLCKSRDRLRPRGSVKWTQVQLGCLDRDVLHWAMAYPGP